MADVAFDARGRRWTCYQLSLDPYDSLWETDGGGATLAHLVGAYGPVLFVNSREFDEVAA